eukprot:587782-Pelagomonas_calceolata.AAC.1
MLSEGWRSLGSSCARSADPYNGIQKLAGDALVRPNKGLNKLQVIPAAPLHSVVQGIPAAPLHSVGVTATSLLQQQEFTSDRGKRKA